MSRLHFRIHAAQQDLKERLKAGKFDLDDNDEVVGGTQIIPSVHPSDLAQRPIEEDDDEDDFLDAEEELPSLKEPFALTEVNTEIIKQECSKHITEEEALKILGTRHAEK